jgi:DNA-binding NarL/FixJ family response regulator
MNMGLEMRRFRVLLADDDLQMLATTNGLLEAEFDVIQMVSDGSSLIEAALRFAPDLIVTDISMPKMNGFEAVRQVQRSLPAIKSVFLTMHGAREYRREARSLGAGYVLKISAREELTRTIHAVMQGAA